MKRRKLWPLCRPAFGRIPLLLAICAVTLGFCLPGQAQTPAPVQPVISGPPDVVVVVYQQPGADQVGITYAHAVPHTQAGRDIAALTQATGWQINPQDIKDAAAPMEKKFGAMTSIAFQAPGVIQDTAHTFPVETFARAFHTYKRLNIVFFVGPQFQFQGQRFYADNDIKVALDQQGTTYAYQIEITNPNFGSLTLAPSAANAQAGGGHHASAWRIFLGILGTAALVGLGVYFLTARLTPKAQLADTDAETETRQEVGIKG